MLVLFCSGPRKVTGMKERDKKKKLKKRLLREIFEKRLKELKLPKAKETISQPFDHTPAC